MKSSRKLSKKIASFSEAYDGLKKATADVAEDISEMKALTEEGAESKIANFSKKASVSTRHFSTAVEDLKEGVEDLVVAADDLSNVADEVAAADPAMASFSRKVKLAKKLFSIVENKYEQLHETVATAMEAKGDGTTVKESVVPASPERCPDADETVTTTKVSVNQPTEGLPPPEKSGTEVPKAVNFSAVSYYKFSLANALSAFAEFAQELADATDAVEEIKAVEVKEAPVAEATEEPKAEEAPAATVEEPTVEISKDVVEAVKSSEAPVAETAEEPKVEEPKAEEAPVASEPVAETAEEPKAEEAPASVCPECKTEPCTCDQVTKDQEFLVEQGIKAFATGNEEAMKKVSNFCEELETIKPGAGEQVVSTIENFSALYERGFGPVKKNFSTKKFASIGAVKELLSFAADALKSGDKVDIDSIAAKCEDIEKELPGAGDVVVSTIENFCGLVEATKKSLTPETPEDVMKDFSAALEKFVEDIPVVDKTFSHKIKAACFEALKACDENNQEACAKFCNDVSKGLAEVPVTDDVIKNFGKSLNDFCGRFSKFEKKEVEVPEEIAKRDGELNEVIEKMGEKGAQLNATAATFAKKLCESYKSMKCFTEEQLEKKLELVEDLRDDLDTPASEEPKTEEAQVPAATEAVAEVAEEVKAEEPKAEEATVAAEPAAEVAKESAEESDAYDPGKLGTDNVELIEEEETATEDLPSDGSVVVPINFSVTSDEGYDSKLESLFDAN